jgi:hypothetical protein
LLLYSILGGVTDHGSEFLANKRDTKGFTEQGSEKLPEEYLYINHISRFSSLEADELA